MLYPISENLPDTATVGFGTELSSNSLECVSIVFDKADKLFRARYYVRRNKTTTWRLIATLSTKNETLADEYADYQLGGR